MSDLNSSQELAMLSSIEALENRRGRGERITMATARSVITELSSMKLSSPVALEIISKFQKPEWDEIAKSALGTFLLSAPYRSRMFASFIFLLSGSGCLCIHELGMSACCSGITSRDQIE